MSLGDITDPNAVHAAPDEFVDIAFDMRPRTSRANSASDVVKENVDGTPFAVELGSSV